MGKHQTKLFKEWGYTAFWGRPSIWKHPIKWFFWGKWNRITNHNPNPEIVQPTIRDWNMGPSRDFMVERERPTKAYMKELTADSAVFM